MTVQCSLPLADRTYEQGPFHMLCTAFAVELYPVHPVPFIMIDDKYSEKEFNISNVYWPRHADGSSDFDKKINELETKIKNYEMNYIPIEEHNNIVNSKIKETAQLYDQQLKKMQDEILADCNAKIKKIIDDKK